MATLAELKAQRVKAHDAINEILDSGQSVSADGRSLTMANLSELRATVDWLDNRIAARSKGARNRIIQVIPYV